MRALITGIFGQDGTILKSILVNNGFKVFGVARPNTRSSLQAVAIEAHLNLKSDGNTEIDLSDANTCNDYLDFVKPDRIFHLAAVHGSSLESNVIECISSSEMYNCHVTITTNLLEWIKRNQETRLALALSSQMYNPYQNFRKVSESDDCDPQNIYGKLNLKLLTY